MNQSNNKLILFSSTLSLIILLFIDTSSILVEHINYYTPSFRMIYVLFPLMFFTFFLLLLRDRNIELKINSIFVLLIAIFLVDLFVTLIFTNIQSQFFGYYSKFFLLLLILIKLSKLEYFDKLINNLFWYASIIFFTIGFFDIIGYLVSRPCVVEVAEEAFFKDEFGIKFFFGSEYVRNSSSCELPGLIEQQLRKNTEGFNYFSSMYWMSWGGGLFIVDSRPNYFFDIPFPRYTSIYYETTMFTGLMFPLIIYNFVKKNYILCLGLLFLVIISSSYTFFLIAPLIFILYFINFNFVRKNLIFIILFLLFVVFIFELQQSLFQRLTNTVSYFQTTINIFTNSVQNVPFNKYARSNIETYGANIISTIMWLSFYLSALWYYIKYSAEKNKSLYLRILNISFLYWAVMFFKDFAHILPHFMFIFLGFSLFLENRRLSIKW